MIVRATLNILQLRPCQSMSRIRIHQRVVMLIIAACLATHLHWLTIKEERYSKMEPCEDEDIDDRYARFQITDVDSEKPQCINASEPQQREESDVLGCTPDNSEIVYKDDVRVLGKPLTEKVFITIGLPTVERVFKNKSVSYIEKTLNSLITNMNPEDMKEVLLVVFLADFNAASRTRLRRMLETQFKKYIDMNLIHVIEAPRAYYPPLTGLTRTFNDKPERMYWRSKQNIDYVFLFSYCEGLSQYYMQLEDDVISEPKFLDTIKDVLQNNSHLNWTYLQFNYWGFIGKFFRNDELQYLRLVWRKYYCDLPCDWILQWYRKFRGDEGARNAYFGGEIFHHIGHQSSSLGT